MTIMSTTVGKNPLEEMEMRQSQSYAEFSKGAQVVQVFEA